MKAQDGYLPLKALAPYSGLSVRTLREYLADRTRPLPHYRVGGKILVRQSDYDAWVAQFKVSIASVALSPAGIASKRATIPWSPNLSRNRNANAIEPYTSSIV